MYLYDYEPNADDYDEAEILAAAAVGQYAYCPTWITVSMDQFFDDCDSIAGRFEAVHDVFPESGADTMINWRQQYVPKIEPHLHNRGMKYRYEDIDCWACKCHNLWERSPNAETRCGLCGSAIIHPYRTSIAHPIGEISESDLKRAYAHIIKHFDELLAADRKARSEWMDVVIERANAIEEERAKTRKRAKFSGLTMDQMAAFEAIRDIRLEEELAKKGEKVPSKVKLDLKTLAQEYIDRGIPVPHSLMTDEEIAEEREAKKAKWLIETEKAMQRRKEKEAARLKREREKDAAKIAKHKEREAARRKRLEEKKKTPSYAAQRAKKKNAPPKPPRGRADELQFALTRYYALLASACLSDEAFDDLLASLKATYADATGIELTEEEKEYIDQLKKSK